MTRSLFRILCVLRMNIYRAVKQKLFWISSLFRGMSVKGSIPEFAENKRTGLKQRAYESYEQYLEHQGSKLREMYESILGYDKEYEEIVKARYAALVSDWKAKSVLCLAARLGGEVRAFKSLGALAIGLDVEPGEKNCHVLYGDFHDIDFPEKVFDYVFSNAIDHIYDLDKFISEVNRVLKCGGYFIVELCIKEPGRYESLDLAKDKRPVLEKFSKYFLVTEEFELDNRTQYVEWAGLGLLLKKRC